MARYEVIAGIYKSGSDDSLEEETLLETDDLSEAQDFLAELAESDEPEEDDPGEEDAEDSEPRP